MKTAPGRRKVGWWVRAGRTLGLLERPLGDRGERAAARYLQKHGVKIIARNRVKGKGEIDLIGLQNDFVLFIEVRTRRSESYMRPEDSIRYWKRKVLAQTVRNLMRRYANGKKVGLRPRIDVVAVIWPVGEQRPKEIRWHRGAIAVGGW